MWLSDVNVTGTVPVTLGTGMVAVPLMIITDALEMMGAPPASVHVVTGTPAGSSGLVGAVVGGIPMVVPLHVVSVVVVVT